MFLKECILKVVYASDPAKAGPFLCSVPQFSLPTSLLCWPTDLGAVAEVAPSGQSQHLESLPPLAQVLERSNLTRYWPANALTLSHPILGKVERMGILWYENVPVPLA